MEPVQELLFHLTESLNSQSFIKLTLSKPRRKGEALRNVYGKRVHINVGERLSLTYRYETRDEVRNIGFEQAAEVLGQLLETSFLVANLITLSDDYELLLNKKGNARLTKKAAVRTAIPEAAHDRDKQRLLDPLKPYWFQLGLTGRDGKVTAAMQHKWKQINRYIDILSQHLNPLMGNDRLKIVDMGAGKGYLTFALYEHLMNQGGNKPELIGVEQRKDLVDKCNSIAAKSGLDGLRFEQGAISDFPVEGIDVLIALHACDTATDDAIAAGIRAKAALIVCAPCCHKHIRKQITANADEQPVLRYGIMLERQAELLTDTLRALIMEKHGYKSQVQEFIDAGHTPKNLLLTGIKTDHATDKAAIEEKISRLKNDFGIGYHQLERLLENITP